MLNKLDRIVQKRKADLTSYLKSNSDVLPLEKQHQIYGSIKELENFSHILRFKQRYIKKE